MAFSGGADIIEGGAGNDLIRIGDPDPLNDGGARGLAHIPANNRDFIPLNNRAHVDGGDGNDTITVARGYLPMALVVEGPNAGIATPLSDIPVDFTRAWGNAYVGWERAGARFNRTGTVAPVFTGFLRDGVALARSESGALNLYALFQFPDVPLQGGSALYAPLFVYDATFDNDDSAGHNLFGGAGQDIILSATDLDLTRRLDQNSPAWAPPQCAIVWTQGCVWGIYTKAGDPNVENISGPLSTDSAPDFIFAGNSDDKIVAGIGNDYLDGGKGEAGSRIKFMSFDNCPSFICQVANDAFSSVAA